MKVLVTGATGNVGTALVAELLKRDVTVRVLVRKQSSAAKFGPNVEVAVGDLLDPVSVAAAVKGVDKIYLLNAVAADELTQALIVYGIANRQKIEHIVYHSVFRVELFRDVPHFAAKLAVEEAIREFGVPYTILRPGYFMQNDATWKDLLVGQSIYPMPIGHAGIAAVDIRDIAEGAAIVLTQPGHEGKTYDLVASDLLSGPTAASAWSTVLGKEIKYIGENFDALEEQMRRNAPSWSAFDIRMMFQGYFDRGFASTGTESTVFAELLGHEPRKYTDFAAETAHEWKKQDQSNAASDNHVKASTIPPDDSTRKLLVARPNKDSNLPHIGLVGDTYTTLLSGHDTAGHLCLIDMHIPPEGGPPPHRHDFEETFIVLDGEIEAVFRGVESLIKAGETIHIPANAPHQFKNASNHPVRLLCICAPSGQEEFFAQVGIPVESRTTAPPLLDNAAQAAFIAKVLQLAPQYRTELLPPK